MGRVASRTSRDIPNPMSETTQALIEEIKAAPEDVQREVFDFLIFLKARLNVQAEGAERLLPLAQTAWAADWNTPEEDEAWRDVSAATRPSVKLVL